MKLHQEVIFKTLTSGEAAKTSGVQIVVMIIAPHGSGAYLEEHV